MPKYIVKTVDYRNLVIEADRYSLDPTERTYEFFAKDGDGSRATKKVATVFFNPELLAILEDKAGKADFYNRYDVNKKEAETDDACLRCRFLEFLQDPEFFDEVYSIIDFYHSPDNEDEPAQTVPGPGVPAEKYPIEHWRDKDGDEWWGFHTDEGFVHCESESFAQTCRECHLEDPVPLWSYLDLTGATKLED